MSTFGLSGCRVKPRRPHQTGPPGLAHDSPRTPNVHIFRAPALQTPKFHDRTPREKEERKLWREEGKKAKFWAPHPSGFHPSGLHPSGLQPFGAHFFWVWASTLGASTLWEPHPLWSKNSTSKNWPKSKLAEFEIGRSRNWPKSNWPNSKKQAGRSRNWPKSITPCRTTCSAGTEPRVRGLAGCSGDGDHCSSSGS